MKKQIPEKLSPYKKTKIFTSDTVPKALQKDHQIIKDSWAKLMVIEGELILKFQNQTEGFLITANSPGIIEPEIPHHIEVSNEVSFYIEFYN